MRYTSPNNCGELVLIFFFILPFSPLLPFFFYFADKKSSALVEGLGKCCWFEIYMEDINVSKNASKLRQFMMKKIAKHIGFILEALVEAFPQAILQMVAIVVFREANPIAITSIMISLLSVSSKSLILSVACALNIKQLLLNWLSAVTDFFGIFVVCAWCFYRPATEAANVAELFETIQSVWLYKLYICIFPMVAYGSVCMYFVGCHEMYSELTRSHHSACHRIYTALVVFVVVTVLWAAGIVCSTLTLEIMNVTLFGRILEPHALLAFPSGPP